MAPLDEQGRLSLTEWAKQPDKCGVVRFWSDALTLHGKLRRRSGPEGNVWFFDFDPATDADDRVGYRLDEHRFSPGEYITLTDDAGSDILKVMSVASLSDLAGAPTSPFPTAEALEAEANIGYDPHVG
ncbi:hypothetical protein [Hansschlegelia zhihuaiae]|uniref:Uncharacterized protein n=1 Tax=Hansschlegelia zhihuaiae TaxID=405005 RepID=A0A4Q0MI44_9HYPH|nr:hypothetical protein [Hansschlegelia zhihuaiae]RXF73208.1 hypothetical protein EK403_12070 [Hansschlegelia zhihuaiae]